MHIISFAHYYNYLCGPMASSFLKVEKIEGKGRGMFTKKAIKVGTIIETAPVIILEPADRKHIDKTILYNYIFAWEPDGRKDLAVMALGTIPLYNHSYESNCEYYMDYDNDTIFVQAVRNIEAGEELTINYNASWNDKTPVWFDAI